MNSNKIKTSIFIFLVVLSLITERELLAFDPLKYFKGPVYKSSATIEVIDLEPKSPYVTEKRLDRTSSQILESAIPTMKSRSMVEDIIQELDLDADVKNELEFRELVEKIRNGIEVTQSGSTILTISCLYSDPLNCQKIVNLLVRKYIKEQLEFQEKSASAGLEFLNKEIELYKTRMEKTGEEIERFEEDNLTILSMIQRPSSSEFFSPPPKNTFADQYQNYSQRLIDLGIELKSLRGEKKNLEKELKSTAEIIISDREVDQNKKEAVTVIHSLNPIYQDLNRDLVQVKLKITNLETKYQIVQEVLNDVFEKMKQIPEKARDYAQLQIKYDNYSKVYSNLIEKRENAYLERRLQLEQRGTRIRIIDNARIPLEPYK